MKKINYNKSEILKRAWQYYRANNTVSFADCLRKSWHIAKNGENCETYEQVFEKYNKEIYRYILNKIKKTEIAEELAMMVFIKLYKHFNNYDVYKGKIKTWLYTIANNLVIDYYRTNHSDKFVHVSDFIDNETGKETYQIVAPESFETETVINSNEQRKRIELAFANLKPKYKRIATLYFIEDKQYNEIAEICEIPIGTVKGMINRCRAMLQASLSDLRM